MAKRFNHFQTNKQANKKPKLDISVNNRNYPGTSKAKVAPAKPKNIFDTWGDDEDDDVILLASQALDTVEKYSQQIIVDQQQPYSDITFSNFAREVQSSTQLVQPAKEEVNDFFKDDDGAFDNLDYYFSNENAGAGHSTKEKSVEKIDKPSFKAPSSNIVTHTNHKQIEKNYNLEGKNEMFEENCPKSNAKDIQVNYLKNKLEKLRKDNEKLTKDISQSNDKLQTKDGEVTMLRYELSHLKQSNENLKLEKMQENETVKKEWQDKIMELEKLVKSQQSELQFKSIEIMNIKSRKLTESQRLSENTFADVKKNLRNSVFLYSLHMPFKVKSYTENHIPIEIFYKISAEGGKYTYRDTLFNRELCKLQSVLSQYQVLTSNEMKENVVLRHEVIVATRAAISEFRKYVQELVYTKYRDTNALVEYNFLCRNIENTRLCKVHVKHNDNIFQNRLLYRNEKACLLRRFIGALGVICRNNPSICNELLFDTIENSQIVDVIIKGIDLLGFSKELYSHFGVIKAFGFFLNSLAPLYIKDTKKKSFLNRFLKSLIFCRPESRSLVEISEYLNLISENDDNNNLLDSLCPDNSTPLVTHDYYKIFQFSPDSCILHVYGILLEAAMPQYRVLNQTQIDSLFSICYNHLRFLRNCFERQPQWIWSSTGDIGSCECYIKLATSAVILLHTFLKQWISRPKTIDIRKISKISKIGSLLLCDIFHINYRREVLHTGELKHRLQIICDWLLEYKTLFKFKSAHYNALQTIKLSHIIADPIKSPDESICEQSTSDGDELWCHVE